MSSGDRRPVADPISTSPSWRVVLGDRTGFERVREVAVVARLLPVVAEDLDARDLFDRNLGLVAARPRPSGSRCPGRKPLPEDD